MTVLAADYGILAPGPSVLQGLLVLALVGVITAREVVRISDPRPRSVAGLDVAVFVLTPVVFLLLGLRLLFILL